MEGSRMKCRALCSHVTNSSEEKEGMAVRRQQDDRSKVLLSLRERRAGTHDTSDTLEGV